jgi:hypothetical protein
MPGFSLFPGREPELNAWVLAPEIKPCVLPRQSRT